eukprot:TRINITY_DN5718_c0_g1_i1.p1 TRINITY_DN5718_c0_g1~~TRINITY_DN5718_c0_g1_i1.p1  ORF type:complete len:191 (+),score=19.83 TRINITY_DN5718_c0_g1_i1:70-573(+)
MVQRAISSAPSLLSFVPSKINKNMAMLTFLGLDARMTVKRFPLILTRNEQAIRDRITFFEERGLDAVRIINALPHVVSYDIHRKLRPLTEYITQEMGRSLEEINECPRCFSTSLEQRLKPRHEYLKLHGKRQDYSLSSLCATTDNRFVAFCDRSVEHYHQWLVVRPH